MISGDFSQPVLIIFYNNYFVVNIQVDYPDKKKRLLPNNFDQNIEIITGHETIHNTHGVAYQNISDLSSHHNAAVKCINVLGSFFLSMIGRRSQEH